MDRRDLLAAAGLAGLVGTAGCLGYDVVDDGTIEQLRVRNGDLRARLAERTERVDTLEERVADLRARLAAQEAQVEAVRERLSAPTVNAVHVVDGWAAVGDVFRRQVDAVDRDAAGALAVNFSYPPKRSDFGSQGWWNGEATVTVTIREADDGNGNGNGGGDGDSGAGTDADAAVAGREWTMRVFTEPDQRMVETDAGVDLGALPPGEYEATATVTDALTSLSSTPQSTTFRVR